MRRPDVRTATLDELNQALGGLVGLPCWSAIAGKGTGSRLSMRFGEKFLRARPLANPHLTAEERAFDARNSLFIECAWRLDSVGGVVCSCSDSNEKGERMLTGLATLVGATVTRFEVRPPAHDLTIWFGDDRRLSLFCDQTGDHDSSEYVVFRPTYWIAVGLGGSLVHEPDLD